MVPCRFACHKMSHDYNLVLAPWDCKVLPFGHYCDANGLWISTHRQRRCAPSNQSVYDGPLHLQLQFWFLEYLCINLPPKLLPSSCSLLPLQRQWFGTAFKTAHYSLLPHLSILCLHPYNCFRVGFKFVEAELPRQSNERLLNNLKEGVIILNKSKSEILFTNFAARQTNQQVKKMYNRQTFVPKDTDSNLADTCLHF